MIIDYPAKSLDMIGTEQTLVSKTKAEKYFCEDVRFSDAAIVKADGVKYLALEFLFNNFKDKPFWTPPFPTDIKAPKISKEYTKMMTEDAMQLIQNIKPGKTNKGSIYDMDDLTGLTEFVKTQKGLTNITLEDLMDFVPEYEIWKQRN